MARRPIAWWPLLSAFGVGAALIGVIVWQSNLQAIERQIRDTRAGLKKLALSGGVPPTQEVVDYLTGRQSAIEERYRHWLTAVAAPPLTQAASANPQLEFQEQLRDVQRTLERLATARGLPVPEQLGFPKELPPPETVPRLLGQLALIREAATLFFEQGVSALASLKVEDPESVYESDGTTTLLVRVPVRVHVTASLAHLMKVLSALEHAKPLIDLRGLRVLGGERPEALEVELVLCRYLVTPVALEPSAEPPGRAATDTPAATKRAPRQPRQSGELGRGQSRPLERSGRNEPATRGTTSGER